MEILSRTRVCCVLSTLFAASLLLAGFNLQAQDVSSAVRKAVVQNTLDQDGTRPFHLHAVIAPSFERDRSSGRSGEVEIWWKSPQHWRREVRTPGFHQVEIVDGSNDWQSNEGDYFPEWLREIVIAIIRPVPLPMDQLLPRVQSGKVLHDGNIQTDVDWQQVDAPGDQQVNGPGKISINSTTGLLFYTLGPGWSGNYQYFADFHGRQVARTVTAGSPQVTAKVDILEDLRAVPARFFDAAQPGSDSSPLRTVVLSEADLRNLLTSQPAFQWPPVIDGPFEGVVWSTFGIDRTGRVREFREPISDNPALRDAAAEQFRTLQFKPLLRDGIPVQVIARFSVPFKTTRPAGTAILDSARQYFERGRKTSYLAYNNGAPYVLRAEFQVLGVNGVQTGRYEDTWLSPTEWKREAWLGANHFARVREGAQYYKLSEGPDTRLLQFFLIAIEPIPTTDTMTESDWRVRRVSLDGADTIRVIRGPENPDGTPQDTARDFWFATDGPLLKSFTNGFEIVPAQPEPYNGVPVPREINLLKDGKLAMQISVKRSARPRRMP